ncbi:MULTISPECIES: hypothetical protein [unclassified Neisseria]|uniref:hypothetical protein n=1 Tax=unclassified Neisseria TaxID=2623750 RepID=UPI0026652B7A|nr:MULTISPECIES: hypothetical protein [unclassified Neisseria]MDO1509318.1 hypothetical protein [Neisseria sp. MVDL19-042950]MDO1515403.1 hypothetical protein [Neisseria sp. MVDL18-041461]MDO1562763.1 hypothetical protein [Neisseria sp. MVDL20-010259]
MTKREELLEKQRQLHVVFNAWMADKKQREVVVYLRENGDLIRHYPDGKEKVIKYAVK